MLYYGILMSSFDEFATSNGQSRRSTDNSPSRSGVTGNGDDAALTGLFQQAFGSVQPLSQDISSAEEFPLDSFEAGVMTACLLSATDNVPVPVNFEEQVMARIGNQATPAGETPRSVRSPLLRHTSRELYTRYRKVVQVVFPLAAAASIVLAVYVHENGISLGSIFTWPPFSTTQAVEPAGSEVNMPEFTMPQPPAEQPPVQLSLPETNDQSAVAKKASSSKKKGKRQENKVRIITGE